MLADYLQLGEVFFFIQLTFVNKSILEYNNCKEYVIINLINI